MRKKNKKCGFADTDHIGEDNLFSLGYKKGLSKNDCFSIALCDNKKTARSFVAEIYRSGNAAGDYCKATLWHTQTSA